MKMFRIPKDIAFGWGSLEYLKSIKGERAFIVTDKTCVSLGFTDKISAYLKEAGIESEIFAEVEEDPSRDTVQKGAKMMSGFQPDWIIGLGGGSSMDAAKGMWVLYEHPDIKWEDVFVPFGVPELRKKARFIAIATTSGTGSEVTCAAVITDRSTTPPVKGCVATTEILPDISISDPELASTMPPKVTAATGMDVLTHATEAYTSIAASVIDQSLALKAIDLTFGNLAKATLDGRNKEAREGMHTASLMAAMAFTNAFLGIVHSLAHQIGAEYHIPHGYANSLMLPYVIRFNGVAVPEKYAEICKATGIAYDNERDAVDQYIKAVLQLQGDVGLSHTIEGAGVERENFFGKLDQLAQNALNDICTYNNPRTVTVEDMKAIYTAAYNGEWIS
ncbi:butanol dehydrogenase [Desulfonema ishimotonii]|uniref:Butanol dehydrogenase n=2 Tax=Desulfonema ishimotonii TaxID=45657 RepID=A0A401FYY1_9BACT|nr:butanol dehydrogenase [Desulfonema ishimotonii]